MHKKSKKQQRFKEQNLDGTCSPPGEFVPHIWSIKASYRRLPSPRGLWLVHNSTSEIHFGPQPFSYSNGLIQLWDRSMSYPAETCRLILMESSGTCFCCHFNVTLVIQVWVCNVPLFSTGFCFVFRHPTVAELWISMGLLWLPKLWCQLLIENKTSTSNLCLVYYI